MAGDRWPIRWTSTGNVNDETSAMVGLLWAGGFRAVGPGTQIAWHSQGAHGCRLVRGV
jgi:hypothetical protein